MNFAAPRVSLGKCWIFGPGFLAQKRANYLGLAPVQGKGPAEGPTQGQTAVPDKGRLGPSGRNPMVKHADLRPRGYVQDVPLECPKIEMVKKWSGNGFGPSQISCPKSGQKVPKKWSNKGPGKIWDHKNTNFVWVFDK